jgi:anti-sigma-K factor RskA
VLYALGALTQQEARSFEIHLREHCQTCQTLVRHFARIVDSLGYGVSGAEPSSYLRDLFAARVEREPRQPSIPIQPSVEAPPLVEDLQPEPQEQETSPPVSPFRKPRRSALPWLIAAGFATAAVLCFFFWQTGKSRADRAIAEEQAKASAAVTDAGMARTLLESERGKARELEQIRAALASPGMQVLFVRPQVPDANAAIAIFWNKEKGRWIVTGHIPKPPAGKDYQLWFMTPASKISAVLLEPDATGHCYENIEVPPVLTQITAAAITIEPKGGSEQPTTRAFALTK